MKTTRKTKKHNIVLLLTAGSLLLLAAVVFPSRSSLTTSANSASHPQPPVYAHAASLFDVQTGQVLYAKNETTRMSPFSLTKFMTALIAVERGNLNQHASIDQKIEGDFTVWLTPDSSLMGIKEGETYTLRELLDGLLLASGNDAAVVIADLLGGSVPGFVALMNEQAQHMGMRDTHFTNPHGLFYPTHYSSARDLGILGHAALANPIIHAISTTKEIHLAATRGHPAYDLLNENQFLWWYPGVDGGKTGWDGEKNFNQIIEVSRGARHLLGVVLSTIDWWTDMRDLMNWGFNTYTWISPRDVDAVHPLPYDADWNHFAQDAKENTIPIGPGARYYISTGYSIGGLIMTYFDQHGGLSHFGFPRGQPKTINTTTSQRFDRATITCDGQSHHCHA
jgi:D-alanyl-D-alanine carboxypeptidase